MQGVHAGRVGPPLRGPFDRARIAHARAKKAVAASSIPRVSASVPPSTKFVTGIAVAKTTAPVATKRESAFSICAGVVTLKQSKQIASTNVEDCGDVE
jgi:hypothetical protein